MQQDQVTSQMYPRLCLVLMITLLSIGCALTSVTSIVPTDTGTTPDLATNELLVTSSPTTEVLATVTNVITSGITPTTSSTSCPTRTDSWAASEESADYLVLNDSDERFIDRLYRLRFIGNTLETFLQELPRGYVEKAITSPDGQWVAFTHEENSDNQAIAKRLVVASADGRIYVQLLSNSDWSMALSHWESDNQHVVAYAPFDEASLPGLRPDKIYLINPFAESREVLSLTFKYSSDELWEFWRGLGGSVAYDPTMSRVVILDDAVTWVLYDVEGAQELWRSFLFGVPYPAWNKSGTAFAFPVFVNGEGGARDPSAVVDQVGFEIVNRDGEVMRTGPIVSVETSIQFYGLSPTGRYIWFHVSDGPLRPGLYLWDIAATELIDCFVDSTIDPIWSPSGNQFLIKATPPDGSPSALRIVDLESQIYFETLPTRANPIAWLRHQK
jgi:hypothetical protein